MFSQSKPWKQHSARIILFLQLVYAKKLLQLAVNSSNRIFIEVVTLLLSENLQKAGGIKRVKRKAAKEKMST